MEKIVKRIRTTGMCIATEDMKLYLKRNPEESLELTSSFNNAFVTRIMSKAEYVLEKCRESGMNVEIKYIQTYTTIS